MIGRTPSLAERSGFRGYASARIALGRSTPQHVQQLVMRDYCVKRGMTYLLAATEYCMPGSTMILDGVLAELARVQGIVIYSLGLLPTSADKRREVYRRVIEEHCTLHLAVEGLVVASWADAQKLEELWIIYDVIAQQGADVLDWLEKWDRTHARDQFS